MKVKEETNENVAFSLPNKKVKIVFLGKTKFSGLSSYPRTPKVITCQMDNTGLYKTGLTPEEEKYFESRLKLSEGSLSRKPADVKGTNFWADLEIRLDPKRNNELYLGDIIQYIKYKVMLASTRVCNSPLEKSKWPNAEWMIFDEEQNAEIESKEFDYEIEATELFAELSEEKKKGVLKLFNFRKLENSSPSLIKSALFKEMKKDPKKFITIVKDKNLEYRILLEDLVRAKIITRNGNYFKNGDDPIGNSTEEVISYLQDPKNQTVLIALKGKLKKSS